MPKFAVRNLRLAKLAVGLRSGKCPGHKQVPLGPSYGYDSRGGVLVNCRMTSTNNFLKSLAHLFVGLTHLTSFLTSRSATKTQRRCIKKDSSIAKKHHPPPKIGLFRHTHTHTHTHCVTLLPLAHNGEWHAMRGRNNDTTQESRDHCCCHGCPTTNDNIVTTRNKPILAGMMFFGD